MLDKAREGKGDCVREHFCRDQIFVRTNRLLTTAYSSLVTCNTLTEKQKRVFYTRVKFRSTFFVEMKLLSSVRGCDSEAVAIVLSVLK